VSVQPKRELGQHFLVDQNVLGVIGRPESRRRPAADTGQETLFTEEGK